MLKELKISNLHTSTDGKEILKGLNLSIKSGEIHAIMGPNGSGKSTLAYTIAGHPRYTVEHGIIEYNRKDLKGLSPEERAREGIFLAFQYPVEVPGVPIIDFLKTARGAVLVHASFPSFMKELDGIMKTLGIEKDFLSRYLNEDFSGGEKKKAEILQMAVLQPSMIILDETDSGLDIDALQTSARGVNELRPKDAGVLIITHYQRILNYIKPDFVHVLKDGKIIKSGGIELAEEVERKGYGAI